MRFIVLLLLAVPLAAQTPIRPRTITEFSIGTRLVRSGEEDPFNRDNGKLMATIGLGRVTPVGVRTSLGGVFSAGVLDGYGYLALGPRLRYHASKSTTLDITPSLMVTRSEELAGPLIVDVAVMHNDKVGLSIQAAAGARKIWTALNPVKSVGSTSLAAGLRLGGKPGRIGSAVAVASVAAMIILLLTTPSD